MLPIGLDRHRQRLRGSSVSSPAGGGSSCLAVSRGWPGDHRRRRRSRLRTSNGALSGSGRPFAVWFRSLLDRARDHPRTPSRRSPLGRVSQKARVRPSLNLAPRCRSGARAIRTGQAAGGAADRRFIDTRDTGTLRPLQLNEPLQLRHAWRDLRGQAIFSDARFGNSSAPQRHPSTSWLPTSSRSKRCWSRT